MWCDFFFFKQKTAYEMRISDWSLDVCSSDLWTVGGYYLHRNMFLEGRQASTPGFPAARGLTGLPADATFYQLGSDARSYALAGFGELTYHLSDKLSVTGGLRYANDDMIGRASCREIACQ